MVKLSPAYLKRELKSHPKAHEAKESASHKRLEATALSKKLSPKKK